MTSKFRKKKKKHSVIPEDVCTLWKSVNTVYGYQKMHVHENKEIGEYCMIPKDACTNKY